MVQDHRSVLGDLEAKRKRAIVSSLSGSDPAGPHPGGLRKGNSLEIYSLAASKIRDIILSSEIAGPSIQGQQMVESKILETQNQLAPRTSTAAPRKPSLVSNA